jgi:hypothetical protein
LTKFKLFDKSRFYEDERVFWTILVVFIIASCSNMTKEQYLSKYKGFIQQVKESRQDYTAKKLGGDG